jgi:hypothetical protein
MLPPRSFVPGYLLRGLILWIGIRLGTGFAVALGADRSTYVSVIFVHVVVVPFVVGAVFLAARVDDRVRRDELLLADLGVRPGTAAAVSASVALVAEVTLQWLGAVV